ncbi:MAG: hypothetical protein ABSE56_12790 [Bryobacteraceae bacterium]|jgi:hypothetical protein
MDDVTAFKDAVLRTPDGSVVADGFGGYCQTGGTGWFLLTGLPKDFPELRSWSEYILEANGATARISTREVKQTLMVTTLHLSVEFSYKSKADR